MSKAFTRESDDDGDGDGREVPPLAIVVSAGVKNYITPAGYARLKGELKTLVERERPEVVRTVSWAASNGDRSENGDYIYGKRRLREIDWRIRYLMKRLEIAEVVDRKVADPEQVFFGARVTYIDGRGEERQVHIVGIDEVDAANGRVSWISPVARALLKARDGDVVTLHTPAGAEELEIVGVAYDW